MHHAGRQARRQLYHAVSLIANTVIAGWAGIVQEWKVITGYLGSRNKAVSAVMPAASRLEVDPSPKAFLG